MNGGANTFAAYRLTEGAGFGWVEYGHLNVGNLADQFNHVLYFTGHASCHIHGVGGNSFLIIQDKRQE